MARRKASEDRGAGKADTKIAERRASVERRRRQMRWRSIRRALLAMLVIAGTVALLLSPPLRVASVRVQGAAIVDPGEIASLAGAEGRPLAFVNTPDVARKVKESPLVLDARVRTDYLRRTVVIDLVERSPIAYVEYTGGYLLTDRDGVGVAVTDTAPRNMFYLTGPIGPREVGDTSEKAGWAATASEEVSRWTKHAVQSAGHGERGIFIVTTDGAMVYLGSVDRLEEKGRALRAVQAKAEAEQLNLRYVDVTTPENPAVSK